VSPLLLLAYLLAAVTTTWVLVGLVAILWLVARSEAQLGPPVPVTVLKPLAGAGPDLQANLQSFFEQRHPHFQLIFGVERQDDPAIPVVQALMRRYPQVNARLVIEEGAVAQNPKVSNLLKMLATARHDLLLISDAGVRAGPHYLSDLVETKLRTGAGLVTNTFVGVGETSLGAALENVQLNGFVAAGAAVPTLFADAAVVGKSMFFSRRELEDLGGLRRVADLLAEDFVIGKMFQHAGRSVHLGREILLSVNGSVTLRAALDRQLRWSMLRFRLRPWAYLLEPLTSPLVMAALLSGVFGPTAWVWGLALLGVRDVVQWIALRGLGRVHLPLLLAPGRELLMLGVWLATPFVKHVAWRGHRVRLGAGTLVYATRP
jgi:ceramide glucosyltransferase